MRSPSSFAGLSIVLAWLSTAAAQSAGSPCSQARNRLEPGSYAFAGDCGPTLFCAANSTCVPRSCRSADLPFGYLTGSTLPPKCPGSQFCPDEGSGCLSPAAVGQPCQLDRDDECSGGASVRCLNFRCTSVNATLNAACTVENTVFTGYAPSGAQFPFIVSRDNCVDGLYCDGTSRTCLQRRGLGVTCDADKECLSSHCGVANVCESAIGPRPRAGVYSLPLTLVLIGVALLGLLLALNASAERVLRREERTERQFWRSVKADWEMIQASSGLKDS